MTLGTFDDAEIEAGRRMFAAPWDFATAASSVATLPMEMGVEVALAGRSNVGKSSLVNGLTGRKALARTSHTPGRTQELIFFRGDSPLTLVDMPGYGYAEAPRDKVLTWTGLIHDYLRGRRNLARVLVLIDSRHGLKATDDPVLETLDKAAVSYQVVLTKGDALKPPALAKRVAEVTAALKKHPAAFPVVLATSSHTGAGMAELRATLAQIVAERR